MFKLFIALALLVASNIALADQSFNTADEAALEASRVAIQTNSSVEFGGAIYSIDGHYYVTEPGTTGRDGDIDALVIRFPKKATLVAIYHTHPSEPRVGLNDTSDMFSAGDVKFAKKVNAPLYMASVKSGELKVYVPGATKTTRTIQGLGSFGALVARL